jgi:hypothetical protein
MRRKNCRDAEKSNQRINKTIFTDGCIRPAPGWLWVH